MGTKHRNVSQGTGVHFSVLQNEKKPPQLLASDWIFVNQTGSVTSAKHTQKNLVI